MRRSAFYLIALCGFLLALICESPAAALTEPADLPILIVELQTASAESSHDKYVAIYNPNDHAVNVTGWQLQYRTSNATGDSAWHVKASLNCELDDRAANQDCQVTLAAHDKLWMASYDLGSDRPSHDLNASLAIKGGQIRFLKPERDDQPEVVQDTLGYGTAKSTEGDASAPAPSKGASIKRRVDPGGRYINTNNNAADFESTEVPAVPDDSAPSTGTAPSPKVYPAIEITELLPKPSTGAADKFIELFNPTGETADLTGYVLQTGPHWSRHHVLRDVSIIGRGYAALKVSQINLTLSQRGGAVRLLSPDGVVIGESAVYPAAKTGQAWMKTDAGDWQWTTEPTPGAPNKLVRPTTDSNSGEAASAAAPIRKKTRSGHKSAAAASSTTKANKPKSAGVKPYSGAQPASPQVAQNSAKPNANYWFIGAAALLTVGYAIYEYRQDIANLWYRLKNKMGRHNQAITAESEM